MVLTSGINFAARVERGRSYFERLRVALDGTWEQALARALDSDDPLLDTLVLIHPVWLDGFGQGLPDVRGQRGFIFETAGEVCQAPLIWGYACVGTAIEIDHMFPYGLGGPTRADNGLILCREHNRLKGHDVHLLPWDSYAFPWLEDQVTQVRQRFE